MKKKVTGTLLLLLFPMLIWADGKTDLLPIKPELGLKLGMNFSQLNGSSSWDNGYNTNLLGGAYVGIHGIMFGVMVEGLYSLSSYSTNSKDFYSIYHGYYNNSVDSAKQGKFQVSYLNIPILAQIKILPGLWFQIGPQYSMVLGVKDVNNLLNTNPFKNSDFAGVVGINASKLPFNLTAGVRYIIGLSDLNATNVSNALQQHTIQVHIGYRFL
jgi:hypothetical protein